MLHNAATVYAQAAAAEDDRHDYEERALDLLGEALAALPADRRARFWAEQIEPDPDLGSVRRLPRYRELALPYSPDGPAATRKPRKLYR
jgi:hypothetical protein